MSSTVLPRASVLLSSLASLDCPLTRDLPDDRFSDLLFQPGEWRLQLIRWLLTQADARLAQSVEQQAQLAQPRLAHMAAALGLCPLDRPDVFSGSARRLDQLAFFEKLLRLVQFNAEPRASPEEPIRSGEALANELEASVELLNSHLTSEMLLRHLSGAPESLLSPDLGLLLRGRVEKRKAEAAAAAPPAWSMAAWREQLEAEAAEEQKEVEGVCREFATEQCAARQEEALRRLEASLGRFVRAEERTFRAAVEQAAAPKRRDGVEVAAFAENASLLEQKLAAVATLRNCVEKVERGVQLQEEQEQEEQEAKRKEGLAREVVRASR